MFKRNSGPILVPVDFSADSLAALEAALSLASCYGADVIVLHVVHDPSNRPGFYRSATAGASVLQSMEEAAEEMMENFLAENAIREKAQTLGITVIPRLVQGLPVTQILRVAERERASIIVMGSRGLTGLSRWLLGSKSERVVQLSPIPVMVVKAPKEAPESDSEAAGGDPGDAASGPGSQGQTDKED